MSTDCENLLKKFLVLNPTRRIALEVNFIFSQEIFLHFQFFS
jgi:hypothetical protein